MENIAVSLLEDFPQDFEIVEIDANKATTLREFYEIMAEVFEFPDYFSFNLDSFDELMNDLSWIENEKLLIYFSNSEMFLSKERNDSKTIALLDLLDASCEEWKWTEDDLDLIPKKELLVRFSPSDRIFGLLDRMEG